MKPFRGCTRIFILSLLTVSVFVPIFLLSYRLKQLSHHVSKEFDVEDLSVIKRRTEVQAFSAIEEGEGQVLKELSSEVYKDVGFSAGVGLNSSEETSNIREPGNAADDANLLDRDVGFNLVGNLDSFNETNNFSEPGNAAGDANSLQRDVGFHSGVSLGSSNETESIHEQVNSAADAHLLEKNGTNDGKRDVTNQKEASLDNQQEEKSTLSEQKDQSKHDQGLNPQPRRALDEKVKEMIDEIISAKAYLKFEPPTSKSHFAKELRLRLKELEQALGDATKDSELPRRAVQKMKAMEASLFRARRLYPDCPAMDKKLRGMTYSAEQQVRAEKDQTRYLFQLAGRTTPKGLHCLSMRLTSEYFALQPEERELPNQHKLHDAGLYHFAVFSDNVLACAVVVNSTVSNAQDSERTVFHIVTDSLNVPAMTMWFLLNPPGKAGVEIQSIENFGWLSVKYDANLQKQDSLDLRFTSPLNHLRFYLPDIFPRLNKIVHLDHDVVVQRDLTELWEVNLKGKVNGAVTTCQIDEPSFRRMDTFINFTEPIIAKSFDANTCTWAFGMNIFDLQEWRMQDVSAVYHKFLKLGTQRPLMKAGSLPIGWLTFHNQTVSLDRRWHVLGLGYESGVEPGDIEQAWVIHFDGIMKPWLEIGLEKYKPYWKKYVNYHPFLEQCNIET